MIRCLRTRKVNGIDTKEAVFLSPYIVKNPFLLKSTGCIVDDPNVDQKLGRVQVTTTADEEISKIVPEEVERIHPTEGINKLLIPRPSNENIGRKPQQLIEDLESNTALPAKRKRKTKSK